LHEQTGVAATLSYINNWAGLPPNQNSQLSHNSPAHPASHTMITQGAGLEFPARGGFLHLGIIADEGNLHLWFIKQMPTHLPQLFLGKCVHKLFVP